MLQPSTGLSYSLLTTGIAPPWLDAQVITADVVLRVIQLLSSAAVSEDAERICDIIHGSVAASDVAIRRQPVISTTAPVIGSTVQDVVTAELFM